MFVKHLVSETHRIYNQLKVNIPMNLTKQEKIEFGTADTCHLCKKAFTEENYKVRDHNHLNEKYRGAAHNECYLQIEMPRCNYDAHLFIKEMGYVKGPIKIIPQTDEKYISFSQYIKVGYYAQKNGRIKNIVMEMRFLDSFRFLLSSLEKLVIIVPVAHVKVLKKFYSDNNEFD